MFRNLWYPILALVAISSSDASSIERIREAYFNDPERVLVVAHRGHWRCAPENSIEAIQCAIEIGVDIVEIDVRKTSDGRFVLMHDETVNRTTDGDGKVDEMSFSEIRKLHLRNGQGRVTRFKVPSLEEALEAARGNIMLNLDKVGEILPEIATILNRFGMADHIILKGNLEPEKVKNALGDLYGRVIYMPIIRLDSVDLARMQIRGFVENFETSAIEVNFREDTNPLLSELKELKSLGIRIWMNSLWADQNGGHEDDLALSDPDLVYGWLIHAGANIIQTDRPGMLVRYLHSQN